MKGLHTGVINDIHKKDQGGIYYEEDHSAT